MSRVNVREQISLAEVFDSVGQLALSLSMTLFSSGVIRLNSFESVFPGFELVFLLLVLCLECIKLALSIVCVCLHSDGSIVLSVCLLLPQICGHLLRRALQLGHGVILLILVEIEFVTCILAIIIEVCFL